MANQTASSKATGTVEAPENPAPAPAEIPSQEEVVSKVGPTNITGIPPAGTEVIKYVGLSTDYVGLKGSHRELTKTQFKEAGVQNPFTDARTSVMWSPDNGYMIPRSVFTEAAMHIIRREDDLIEITA